jgi:hypothetical protein
MSLATAAALAVDPDFVARVQVAVVKAARDIIGEAFGGEGQPTEAQHERRYEWAFRVLHNPRHHAELMAWGVAAGGVIVADSIDGDIEWTVNGLTNDYAGVE